MLSFNTPSIRTKKGTKFYTIRFGKSEDLHPHYSNACFSITEDMWFHEQDQEDGSIGYIRTVFAIL